MALRSLKIIFLDELKLIKLIGIDCLLFDFLRPFKLEPTERL
jgi:hypothetical protein